MGRARHLGWVLGFCLVPNAGLSSHSTEISDTGRGWGLEERWWIFFWTLGFPDSSVGKESTCNAGDPGSIPGSGRSTGERIGYPLQYSWASLVAQLVKSPPAMQETWLWSLGWEGPLEKGKATHFSILAWRSPWTIQSMGSQRAGHDWMAFTLVPAGDGIYTYSKSNISSFYSMMQMPPNHVLNTIDIQLRIEVPLIQCYFLQHLM